MRMVALACFRQSLTFYCFALFSEVLITGALEPGTWKYQKGEVFFGWVFLF